MATKNIGRLVADEYGIALYSPAEFNEFMKIRKCKARKFLSYFDKHKEVFFESIKQGIFLPVYQISRYNYEILVTSDETQPEIPEEYEKIYCYKDLYCKTSGNKLCFASFGFLEYHGADVTAGITDQSYEAFQGVEETVVRCNRAIGIYLPSGEYLFDLYGLRLKDLTKNKYESYNYAYLFHFKKTDNAINNNFEKADNDNHIFDIEGYFKKYGKI